MFFSRRAAEIFGIRAGEVRQDFKISTFQRVFSVLVDVITRSLMVAVVFGLVKISRFH